MDVDTWRNAESCDSSLAITTSGGEDLLDPLRLLAACGGDALLLRKMTESFQIYAPERLDEVCSAAHRQDFITLRRAAHKLRGMVSTFSTALAARIEILEQAAIAQQLNPALEQCAIVAELIGALSKILLQLSIDDLDRRAAATDSRPEAVTFQNKAINRPC